VICRYDIFLYTSTTIAGEWGRKFLFYSNRIIEATGCPAASAVNLSNTSTQEIK